MEKGAWLGEVVDSGHRKRCAEVRKEVKRLRHDDLDWGPLRFQIIIWGLDPEMGSREGLLECKFHLAESANVVIARG